MIFLLIFFTLASGFFSLSQIALFSLPPSTPRLYKDDPDKRKRLIARLLTKPRELLVTLLMCDIGSNILVQNVAANLFGAYSGWLLKVGVPLVITLLLGEIIPKTIALPSNTRIAPLIATPVDQLRRILSPIRVVLSAITAYLSRVLFFFLKPEQDISIEELHHVLKRSEYHGILSGDEAELINGYLDLSDTTVKERMHPREEILFYDINDPLSKLLYYFIEDECSRVPVCDGDLQNLLGIMEAREFFTHRNAIEKEGNIRPYLRKPTYVPETLLTRTQLGQFLQSDEKLGIVIDEYGAITGLITQEDLFEVVVGEISDRRDEETRYTKAGKDVIITSGKFELSEFEALLAFRCRRKTIW